MHIPLKVVALVEVMLGSKFCDKGSAGSVKSSNGSDVDNVAVMW